MLGRLKDSIDKGIVSVGVKSSTYLETEKIKSKAANAREKFISLGNEMGKAVYEQWKKGEISLEYVESVCIRMKELENEIAAYQLEIERLQMEKQKVLGEETTGILCGCGFRNEEGAKFCVRCGRKLKREEPKDNSVICPSCGAKTDAGAHFCSVCGKELQNSEQ